MIVYCRDCDLVHPDTRKLAPWLWRCMAAKIEPEGFGFVTPEWAPNPPYARCHDKNETGHCDDFEPRRVAKEKAA